MIFAPVVIICFVIFAYAWVCKLSIGKKLKQLKKKLSALRDGISAIDDSEFSLVKSTSKDDVNALKGKLSALFETNGFDYLWKSISQHLRFAFLDFSSSTNSNTVVRVLKDIDDISVPTNILNRHVNMDRIHHLPGLLTGIGLLCTFGGLSYGIFNASEGLVVAESDISESIGSLSPLIQAAGISFLTSLTGLYCSLRFSAFEKTRIYELESLIHDLNDTLKDKFEFNGESGLLFSTNELLREQAQHWDEVKNSLKGEELKDVVRSFDSILGEFITEYFDKMKEMESGILSSISNSEERHDRIILSIDKTLTVFDENLASLFEKNQLAIRSSEDLSISYAEKLKSEYDKITEKTDVIAQSLERLAEVELSNSIDLSGVYNNVNKALDKLNTASQNSVDAYITSMDKFAIDYEKQLKNMLLSMNTEIYQQRDEIIKVSLQDMDKISKASSDSILKELNKHQSLGRDFYDNVEQPVKSLIDMLPASINQLVELNNSYAKNVKNLNYTTKDTVAIAGSMRNVKNDFISLNEVTNDTHKAYQVTRDELHTLNTNIKSLNSGVDDLDGMRELISSIEKKTQSIESLINKIDEQPDLASDVKNLTDTMVELNKTVDKKHLAISSMISHTENPIEAQGVRYQADVEQVSNNSGAQVNSVASKGFKRFFSKVSRVTND
ncbi:hypothetical protein AB4383_18120 [Vibrio breoganii]